MKLFDRLFDDAAIFPPGNTPMPAAVDAHLAHHGSAHAALVGPFVCSTARLAELAATLDGAGGSVELALVTTLGDFDAAVAAAAQLQQASLQAVEVKMETTGAVDSLPNGVAVWCEYPWGAEFDLPAGTGLKLRTGGEAASDFPTERELASAIMACTENGVPFKLTAGLHHAIRSTDSITGFEHHGFLNIMLATRAALRGRSADSVIANLANRDPEHVAERVRRLSEKEVWSLRRSFRSFGTCDINGPIADLSALDVWDGAIQ